MTPAPQDQTAPGPPGEEKPTSPPAPAEAEPRELAQGPTAADQPPTSPSDPDATRSDPVSLAAADPDATRCAGGAAPAPPLSQLSFADYEILAKIGPGGQGIVYKARQLSSGQIVALKMIRRESLTNPEVLRRWQREVMAGLTLSHPNIVRLLDADMINQLPYLVMEYVPGLDLRRLVERTGPLPAARACDFICQAARGLEHALENHLVHRDIKPANLIVTPAAAQLAAEGSTQTPQVSPALLLTPGAVVKILDMGLARFYRAPEGEESWSTLTQDGSFMGTPDFMAPEQWENPHTIDIRADLYSLGCTFYYLLTGQVPFPGGTLIQKSDRHRQGNPVPVETLRPEITPNLGAVLRKMMAKKAADRYQTPTELFQALKPFSGQDSRFFYPRPKLAPRGEANLPPGEVRCFAGHADAVTCLAVVPGGRQVLSGSHDRSLRLWDVDSGTQLQTFQGHTEGIRCVAVASRGKQALSGGVDRSLRLWDLASGRCLRTFLGHTDAIRCAAFAPDDRQAISASNDRQICFWDLASGRPLLALQGHSGDINSLQLSPDGRLLLSCSWDKTVRFWEAKSGKELRTIGGTYSSLQWAVVLDLAFSPDGCSFAGGCSDHVLRLWDVATGQEMALFTGHADWITTVAVSPNGRWLLSGSRDRTVRLWSIQSRRELHRFEGHTDHVLAVAFTPDGQHAISGGQDRSLRLWRLPR